MDRVRRSNETRKTQRGEILSTLIVNNCYLSYNAPLLQLSGGNVEMKDP